MLIVQEHLMQLGWAFCHQHIKPFPSLHWTNVQGHWYVPLIQVHCDHCLYFHIICTVIKVHAPCFGTFCSVCSMCPFTLSPTLLSTRYRLPIEGSRSSLLVFLFLSLPINPQSELPRTSVQISILQFCCQSQSLLSRSLPATHSSTFIFALLSGSAQNFQSSCLLSLLSGRQSLQSLNMSPSVLVPLSMSLCPCPSVHVPLSLSPLSSVPAVLQSWL
jgi:hypothetical protein